jgi:predicted nucleotidyltransferase
MSHYPAGEEPSMEMITQVVAEAIGALESEGVPHLLMGGAGAQTFARPRETDDIDVFVAPGDARRALDVLEKAGFWTEETFPSWLYKAIRNGVLVDVIFRSSGGVYLDDEMLARGQRREYRGTEALLMSPEDLLVVKAMASTEETPHHWYDALALIARRDLDWDYVLARSRVGPRRMLSLLLFAESVDLAVPPEAVSLLFERTHPSGLVNGSTASLPEPGPGLVTDPAGDGPGGQGVEARDRTIVTDDPSSVAADS